MVAAFLLFGLRNAGTPLEMASTPVSAAHPEEKVRASKATIAKPVKAAYFGSGSIPYWALSTWIWSPSTRMRNRPIDHHAQDREHEAVGGNGEQGAGLP